MPEPTMVATADDLHVGRIAMPAWQAAVERLATGSADGAGEEQLLQWRAAGILDEQSALAPDWERAIDAQARAKVALTLVARQYDVAFLTNLYACPEQECAVAVTVRATVGEGRRIDVVNPQAEVAWAPLPSIWPLLRRVLPPVDAMRADVAAVGESYPVEPTEAALAAADAAPTSVFVFAVDAASGASEEVAWYVADGVLHRLHARSRDLQQVAPGDVAAGLTAAVERLLGR
ncbi:hypothetical protein FOJ82_10925 [Tessaracoccus rhinocerotis]|uniref:ESX secretion-associated protein EspG n=1 Tax=Tessaracoccus rhinocerotis TaxID=1689449 RepID=A0A553JZA1_9ACTN|nr:hypothetical protein [Tessaracoccus rhinocerotis]TRY17781.1 hypothetical protein FOJ82_10925 [Tessaracoccus rhinocerotis]